MKNAAAILSGKGGVGKTLLTAAFGVSLARKGKKVLLADLDMGLRNLDIPLGMEGKLRGSIWSLARGHCFEEDALLTVTENLDFLPASVSADWDKISKSALRDVFGDMAGKYDLILLDCPAGIGKGIRFAREIAESFILVTAPSGASVRDTAKLYGLLGGEKKCAAVLNRAGAAGALPLEEVREILAEVRLGGVIPYSPEIDRAAQKGKVPGYDPRSAFGRAVDRAAETLFGGGAAESVSWEEAGREIGGSGKETSLLCDKGRRMAARWRWRRR